MRPLLTIMFVGMVPWLAALEFDHSHKAWDFLLKKHVNERGQVNYKSLIAIDGKAFESYVDQLGSISSTDFDKWERDEKLAYWINAYNAFTVKAIIDNYPIKARGIARFRFPKNSIRQIPGVWDKITFKTAHGPVTLNYMEHKQLRKVLKEPRIHFAIVCASVGCPALRNRAFTAKGISSELEEVTKAFVMNKQKVRLSYPDRTLYLSKIFSWFAADFKDFKGVSTLGSEIGAASFVSKYLSESQREFLSSNKVKVKWLDYDWSLNEQ